MLSDTHRMNEKTLYNTRTLNRSKYINNVFVTNERNREIYRDNLNLQSKMMAINLKGTGNIQNRKSPGRLWKDSTTPLTRKKLSQKGPLELSVMLNKTYATSMNYSLQK